MERTYLFYDIETSGLNKCFDQVMQFAAIRTDLEFNELDRIEFLIKLNPDVVPSPQAILTHRIAIEKLDQGIPEYEAITKIHQLLNTPGTISLGYNSLGFDDEFLRFAFYRNLLPPYTHQYANGCSRMDLYPVVALYYLFKPEIIRWPKVEGVNSLRLEQLNAINRLADGNAHDAMVDVEATLALARLLSKKREMWDYLVGCFDKKTDLDRASKLAVAFTIGKFQYHHAIMVDGSFGASNCYQAPVLGLGMHNHYQNQSLWLALDSPTLTSITAENIANLSFVYRKRFGEPPLLLPMSERFARFLSSERRQLIFKNLDWLQRNPSQFQDLITYHKEYTYPKVPNLDIDAALYQNGFLTDSELKICQKFHQSSLLDKVSMIDRFTNPQLQTQAIRILGRNYPHVLPELMRGEFNEYLRKVNSSDPADAIVDYRNQPHLTSRSVIAEIDQLQDHGNLDSYQENLLLGLKRSLTKPI